MKRKLILTGIFLGSLICFNGFSNESIARRLIKKTHLEHLDNIIKIVKANKINIKLSTGLNGIMATQPGANANDEEKLQESQKISFSNSTGYGTYPFEFTVSTSLSYEFMSNEISRESKLQKKVSKINLSG